MCSLGVTFHDALKYETIGPSRSDDDVEGGMCVLTAGQNAGLQLIGADEVAMYSYCNNM